MLKEGLSYMRAKIEFHEQKSLKASDINKPVKLSPETAFIYHKCTITSDEAIDGDMSNLGLFECTFVPDKHPFVKYSEEEGQ